MGGHLAGSSSRQNGRHSIVAQRRARAIRERGLTLRKGGGETHVRPAVATDGPATLPPQDIVFVTLKAQSLPAAAKPIARLLAPEGCAVFLLNGIPWWWRHGMSGRSETLPLLDPDGALWREVRPERGLGCVVHSPNEIVEPASSDSGPAHSSSAAAVGKSAARGGRCAAAGGGRCRLPATGAAKSCTARAQCSGNTMQRRAPDPGQQGSNPNCELSIAVMREVLDVAAALGWDLRPELDLEKAARRGKPGMRPSMLQDVVLGRALEVEAVLGQVQAFAREKGVAVPATDVILPLLRALDRNVAAKKAE